MKARVQNCDQCRKLISKEQEKQCMECQYEIFGAIADDVARATIAAVIAVFDCRGRKSEYVSKFYEDLLFVLDYPDIFGEEKLHSESTKEVLARKYGIDFGRIKLKKNQKKNFSDVTTSDRSVNMSEELRKLLWGIVTNYTFGQQREIFVEECAEAIQAAQKLKRVNGTADYEKAINHLREEVADVLIMAEQMRYYLGEEKTDAVIKEKLERQIERIKEEA